MICICNIWNQLSHHQDVSFFVTLILLHFPNDIKCRHILFFSEKYLNEHPCWWWKVKSIGRYIESPIEKHISKQKESNQIVKGEYKSINISDNISPPTIYLSNILSSSSSLIFINQFTRIHDPLMYYSSNIHLSNRKSLSITPSNTPFLNYIKQI